MMRTDAVLRTLLLLFSGVIVGSLTILTSVSFEPFSPIPVSMPILYLVVLLTGALFPMLYYDITAIALAGLLVWGTAIAMLSTALSAGLAAVGWQITFNTIFSLIGVHILTYSVTLLVILSAGCALSLLLRRH